MKQTIVDKGGTYNGRLIREGQCPHCGSDNWETLDKGIDDEIYYYITKCNSCGGRWTDTYSMTFQNMIIDEQ
jgi:uncharacterized Zn finger protein